MEKKERKKESVNLEELDKVSGGLIMITSNHYSVTYTCPECSQSFKSPTLRDEHLKKVHGYKEDFFK